MTSRWSQLALVPICPGPICLELICPRHGTQTSRTHLSKTQMFGTHLSWCLFVLVPICLGSICPVPECLRPICPGANLSGTQMSQKLTPLRSPWVRKAVQKLPLLKIKTVRKAILTQKYARMQCTVLTNPKLTLQFLYRQKWLLDMIHASHAKKRQIDYAICEICKIVSVTFIKSKIKS